MADEHQWRGRIIRSLWNFSASDPDLLSLPDHQQEAVDNVIDQTCRDLCEIAGHEPTGDQCGIPEHDFCVWCRKSMPNQYRRRVTPL